MTVWKQYKLGEVCELKAGGTPSRAKPEYWQNGDIPWVKIGDMKGKYVTSTDEKITKEGLENSSAKLLPVGTVLFSIFASLGEVALLGCEAATNQAIAGIIPNEEVIDRGYLYYYLRGQKQRIITAGRGVAQNNINLSILRNWPIVLPSIETQRRIADVIDKAQALIDKRKQQIELLDEFLQSAFIDIFLANSHSEKIRLSDLCTINPAKSEIRNLDDSMLVSFIPMASVSEDGEIIDQETRVMREVKRGYTYFREGDVLFAKITPCMENGKSAVATGLINQIGFGSTEFHVLRPNKNISGTWLHQLIRLGSFRIAAEKSMTGSAGQKRVPRDFFDRYMVSVPPVELQAFFDELANKVKTQKALMKKSITELEHCFDSIMQKAFRGELFG